MEIRIRATGQTMYEGEFRALHKDTSFPAQLTAELLNNFGADVVFEGPQAQPTRYQYAFRDGVEQINGKWYTKYSVADLDAAGIAAKDAEQATAIRASRNTLLRDSDWTQLMDFPGSNRAAWVLYRKDLRDVPQQAGFPRNVVWPTAPA